MKLGTSDQSEVMEKGRILVKNVFAFFFSEKIFSLFSSSINFMKALFSYPKREPVGEEKAQTPYNLGVAYLEGLEGLEKSETEAVK